MKMSNKNMLECIEKIQVLTKDNVEVKHWEPCFHSLSLSISASASISRKDSMTIVKELSNLLSISGSKYELLDCVITILYYILVEVNCNKYAEQEELFHLFINEEMKDNGLLTLLDLEFCSSMQYSNESLLSKLIELIGYCCAFSSFYQQQLFFSNGNKGPQLLLSLWEKNTTTATTGESIKTSICQCIVYSLATVNSENQIKYVNSGLLECLVAELLSNQGKHCSNVLYCIWKVVANNVKAIEFLLNRYSFELISLLTSNIGRDGFQTDKNKLDSILLLYTLYDSSRKEEERQQTISNIPMEYIQLFQVTMDSLFQEYSTIRKQYYDADAISKSLTRMINIISSHEQKDVVSYLFVHSKNGLLMQTIIQCLENLDEKILYSALEALYSLISLDLPYGFIEKALLQYGTIHYCLMNNIYNEGNEIYNGSLSLLYNGLQDYNLVINISALRLILLLLNQDTIVPVLTIIDEINKCKIISYVVKHFLKPMEQEEDEENVFENSTESNGRFILTLHAFQFLGVVFHHNNHIFNNNMEISEIFVNYCYEWLKIINKGEVNFTPSTADLLLSLYNCLSYYLFANSENQYILTRNNRGTILVDTTQILCKLTSENNYSLMLSILHFLSNAVDCNSKNQSYLVSKERDGPNIIENVLLIYRKMNGNTRLKSASFVLVSHLIWNHKGNQMYLLLEQEQCLSQILDDLMQTIDDDNLLSILSCLIHLSQNETMREMVSKESACMSNLINILCSLLMKYQYDVTICTSIAICLKNLSTGHEQNGLKLVNCNGVEILMDVMVYNCQNQEEEEEEKGNDKGIEDKIFEVLISVKPLLLVLNRLMQKVQSMLSLSGIASNNGPLNAYLPVLNGLVYMNSEYDIELMWNVYLIIKQLIYLGSIHDNNNELIEYGALIMFNLISFSNHGNGDHYLLKTFQNKLRLEDANFFHVLIHTLELNKDLELHALIYSICYNICFNNESNVCHFLSLFISSNNNRCSCLEEIVSRASISEYDKRDNEYYSSSMQLKKSAVHLFVLLNEMEQGHKLCCQILGKERCETVLQQYIATTNANELVDNVIIAKCQQILGQNKLVQ